MPQQPAETPRSVEKLDGVARKALKAISGYDPSARGNGPNGISFDEILDVLGGVTRITRVGLHELLYWLEERRYVVKDILSMAYTPTEEGKKTLRSGAK